MGGEEVENSSPYLFMQKGFYNNINIDKCSKVLQYTHEKALDSPSFIGQLTSKMRYEGFLWAL